MDPSHQPAFFYAHQHPHGLPTPLADTAPFLPLHHSPTPIPAAASPFDAFGLIGSAHAMAAMGEQGLLHFPIQLPRTPHTPPRQHPAMLDAPHATHPMSLGDAQKLGNIGPTRPLTRRRTRQLAAAAAAQDIDGCPAGASGSSMSIAQNAFYVPESASRPQTPTRVSSPGNYYLRQRNTRPNPLSLPAALPMTPHLMSPSYPSTPASASSTFSHFSFQQHQHPRSTSGSVSHPRSASPTPSNVSALTSLSSGAGSAPNSQAYGFSPYQLPTPISGSPAASPGATRAKQRKQRLTPADRKAICLYQSEHPHARQEDVAARFNVERSTVSKIWSNRSKWLGLPTPEEDKDAPKSLPKDRNVKFPDIEAKLVEWLNTSPQEQISDALIRDKAKEFATAAGYTASQFKASAGWVENVKRRLGIPRRNWRNTRTPSESTSSDYSMAMKPPPVPDHATSCLSSHGNAMMLDPGVFDALNTEGIVLEDLQQQPMQLISDLGGFLQYPEPSQPPAEVSAEASMRKVLEFVSSQPESVISQMERESLLRVHQVLANASVPQGVDFQQDISYPS